MVIPDQQFGFRHKHSTVHAINYLLNYIMEELHYNQLIGAVLIDLEKAFDSVWLNGFIYTLVKLGFPRWLIMII